MLEEVKEAKKRGLIAGYKPNRISYYILLIQTGRINELVEVLYKDMEQYREPEQEKNNEQN